MTRRAVWLPFAVFALYEGLVWSLVYRYFGGFHPVAFGCAFTVCGMTVLAIYFLALRILAHKPPEPKQDGAVPPDPQSSSSKADVETLRSILAAANLQLAKSQKEASIRVRTAVSKMPLFLLIGTEGSGKTSAFVHSGLVPKLLAGQVYRDDQIIKTPLCNIWLANGAIFVELAGRALAGQPSEFAALLQVLKPKRISLGAHIWGRRERTPTLKGAVLCCDVTPFLGVPDLNQQSAFVRRVRDALRVIGESFGLDFPVYVILTKADKIPYFGDYFARLSSAEDQQVLGCTLTAQSKDSEVFAEAETKRLTSSFNTLYHSLASKRLLLLPREAARDQKLRAYEFPRELKRIRSNLLQFLIEVFRPDPLQPGPLLRGFYFLGTRLVSAEEGSDPLRNDGPLQSKALDNATVVMQREQVQQALAKKNPAEGRMITRWAFSRELFSRVILEDNAPGSHSYTSRRFDLYRRLALGSGIALLAILTFLVVRSWHNTRTLITEIGITASELPAVRNRAEVLGSLPGLDRLREQLVTLKRYRDDGTPWRSVGLYVGDDLLEPSRKFYFDRFRRYLLDDVEKSFRMVLANAPAQRTDSMSFDDVYSPLKGYLSITTKTCEADPVFLTEVWRGKRQIEKDFAERQFSYFVQEGMPIPVGADDDLLKRGRGYLGKFEPADSIYQGLLEQAKKRLKLARLADYSERYRNVLKGDGEVKAAFTSEGAKAILEWINAKKLGRDPCIFEKGDQQATFDDDRLRRQLRERYAHDYVEAWRGFLAGLTVVGYGGPKDAAAKLEVLAGPESAILAALFMTKENTSFAFGDSSSPARPDSHLGAADIPKIFESAHRLFSNTAGRSQFADDVNKPYRQALRGLEEAMDGLARSNGNNEEANLQAGAAYRSGLNTVKDISDTFPRTEAKIDQEVRRLLEAPIKNAEIIPGDPAKKLQSGVRSLCEAVRNLRKRPFAPVAETEATEADFAALFAFRDGRLWKFKQQYLEPLIEKRNRKWVQRTDASESVVKLSRPLLDYFNRLATISDALFSPDESKPEMTYRIRVDKPDNVTSLFVDAGQEERKEGEYALTWPAQRFKVRVEPGSALADYSGLWSLFSMAADATHRSGGILELDCVWSPGSRRGSREGCGDVKGNDGKKVVVRIHVLQYPNQVEQSFDQGFLDLTGMKCPPATQ